MNVLLIIIILLGQGVVVFYVGEGFGSHHTFVGKIHYSGKHEYLCCKKFLFVLFNPHIKFVYFMNSIEPHELLFGNSKNFGQINSQDHKQNV